MQRLFVFDLHTLYPILRHYWVQRQEACVERHAIGIGGDIVLVPWYYEALCLFFLEEGLYFREMQNHLHLLVLLQERVANFNVSLVGVVLLLHRSTILCTTSTTCHTLYIESME